MWNKKGILQRSGKTTTATVNNKRITVRSIGDFVEEYVAANTPYIAVKFNKAVALLGFIALIENGFVTNPCQPIK